ncbi:PorP/SprF family type IX secretion system membrane protein [Thermaurantimonas aggregans]|uniref:PorP/SprF family type IX secretion system membrane protein n=1 Tax=Thermaurantimonas aggregans TaxID=2173829 RepID=UPI000F57CA36|nr:PorP/SprF family type IX secretion system membrane protein [Thermaurantimonas aggregans]
MRFSSAIVITHLATSAMRRHTSAALLLVITWLTVKAQDPILSQFYINRLYLNPAYAGVNRDLTIGVVNRQQWTNLPGPHSITLATADIGCPTTGVGFGLRLFDHIVGTAGYHKTDFATAVSVNIPGFFGRNWPFRQMRKAKYLIGAGLQYGLAQKRIDWSKLVFSDQIDPFQGIVSPNTALNIGNDVSNLTHDLSAGILFRGEITREGSFFSLGFSGFHLNRPRETKIGLDHRIPTRYTAHFFTHFLLSSPYRNRNQHYLSFGYVRHWQSTLTSNAVHVSTNFGDHVLVGLGLRSELYPLVDRRIESLIFNIGYQFTGFTLSYSYDIVLSALGPQNTAGTHEFGLVYRFENVYFCRERSIRKRAQARCLLIDRQTRGAFDLFNF